MHSCAVALPASSSTATRAKAFMVGVSCRQGTREGQRVESRKLASERATVGRRRSGRQRKLQPGVVRLAAAIKACREAHAGPEAGGTAGGGWAALSSSPNRHCGRAAAFFGHPIDPHAV